MKPKKPKPKSENRNPYLYKPYLPRRLWLAALRADSRLDLPYCIWGGGARPDPSRPVPPATEIKMKTKMEMKMKIEVGPWIKMKV